MIYTHTQKAEKPGLDVYIHTQHACVYLSPSVSARVVHVSTCLCRNVRLCYVSMDIRPIHMVRIQTSWNGKFGDFP